MRPDRDPMEMLAAADPLRDGERLTPEEEREADALLTRLLSTPSAGAERRGGGRGRVRRWTLAAAAVISAAAVVLAATSLVDSDAPGGGIVERAVAAVTRDDVIYHVVERSHTSASFEPGGDRTHYVESWYTSDGRIHQRTFAAKGGRKGRLLEDWAGRRIPGRRVNPRLRWDAWSSWSMPIPTSRSLSASGRAAAPATRSTPSAESASSSASSSTSASRSTPRTARSSTSIRIRG